MLRYAPLVPQDTERRLVVEPATWADHAGRRPFLVEHGLADEPLLAHDAVCALADRLPEADVEMNTADLPAILDSDAVPVLDRRPGELARRIEELRRWMALSYIEQIGEYRALVDRCLADAGPAVAAWGGGMTKREGYIFLSAASSVTPAHVDHEHNFLLQIRGTKRVTIGSFEGGEEEQRALEGMHSGHYGRVRALPPDATTFTIEPGTGVYIPPRAVHMIENTGALSISLSLVWHTPELDRASLVYAMNAKLRRLGITPRPPGTSAAGDRVKSAAVTAWRGAQRLVRR